jgi:hypothetical protein
MKYILTFSTSIARTNSTMKLRAALISMVMLALSSALTVPAPRAAEGEGDPAAECGALGVMTFDPADLPEGVLPSDVRKCRDHPLGRNRHLESASLAPPNAMRGSFGNSTSDRASDTDAEIDTDTTRVEVEARSELDLDLAAGTREQAACEWKAEYGCSVGGYCWKTCGPKGQWCWTASKGGIGSWTKCKTWRDCGTHTYFCARGLGPSSGCSC